MNEVETVLTRTADRFEELLRDDERAQLAFSTLLEHGQAPNVMRVLNDLHDAELMIVVRKLA